MLDLSRSAIEEALPPALATDLLRAALRGGLNPEVAAPRTTLDVARGSLLLMPYEWGGHLGAKLVTVAAVTGESGTRIQGLYVLFDAETLAPIAVLDGPAITEIRTAAVSGLVLDAYLPDSRIEMTVFGAGAQARVHVRAARARRDLSRVRVVSRDDARRRRFLAELRAEGVVAEPGTPDSVADADLVVCATTSREPLFPSTLLRDEAVVVAIGSHEPDAREVDEVVVSRSHVVVESRANSSRENGNLLLARAARVEPRGLVTLSELVANGPTLPGGPVLYIGSGMAWQDLVLAAHCHTTALAAPDIVA